MTAEQTIDYEALTQDAMRGVVRAVLMRAAKTGLPGDHHFYISFDTQAPGVVLSKRLKESAKYQHEMTIVLQHRFWDLSVTDDRFEVKLTFDGIPERLVVPFSAIKVFFDPSVRYGLQFEDPESAADAGLDSLPGDDAGAAAPAPNGIRATTTRSQGPRKPRAPRKSRAADRDGAPASVVPVTKSSPRTAAGATPLATDAGHQDTSAPTDHQAVNQDEEASRIKADDEAVQKPVAPASAGAQIVSLDQFRNKK